MRPKSYLSSFERLKVVENWRFDVFPQGLDILNRGLLVKV